MLKKTIKKVLEKCSIGLVRDTGKLCIFYPGVEDTVLVVKEVTDSKEETRELLNRWLLVLDRKEDFFDILEGEQDN